MPLSRHVIYNAHGIDDAAKPNCTYAFEALEEFGSQERGTKFFPLGPPLPPKETKEKP